MSKFSQRIIKLILQDLDSDAAFPAEKCFQICRRSCNHLTEMRGGYDENEKLVRLPIVCSASFAEAERGFNAVPRLKTWLLSPMIQTRRMDRGGSVSCSVSVDTVKHRAKLCILQRR